MLNELMSFTPCGLILDACGVVLLGFAFFLKDIEAMIEESGTTWDSDAFAAVATSKADGMFGTSLLFLGFVYQIIGFTNFAHYLIVMLSYVVLLVFLVLYFTFLRRALVNRWLKLKEEHFRKRDEEKKWGQSKGKE